MNKCCVPGCQSNYKKKDVEYKYVPIFSFPKKEDLRNEWKRKIPRDNLVVTQNSKVCMKHFEGQDLWKSMFFRVQMEILILYVLMNYNYQDYGLKVLL